MSVPLWGSCLSAVQESTLLRGFRHPASCSIVFLQQAWECGAHCNSSSTMSWLNLESGCLMVRGGIFNLLEKQQQADRLPRNRKCLCANFKHYFNFSTFFSSNWHSLFLHLPDFNKSILNNLFLNMRPFSPFFIWQIERFFTDINWVLSLSCFLTVVSIPLMTYSQLPLHLHPESSSHLVSAL